MAMASRRGDRGVAVRMAVLILLVLYTVFATSDASKIRAQRRSLLNNNVASLVASKSELSILSAALRKAELKTTLAKRDKTFTLFAPSNDALEKAFKDSRLICVHDLPCTSTSEFLSSTNLGAILLNFVVEGSFRAKDLTDGELLYFAGSSVEKIHKTKSRTYVGSAKVLTADLLAGNGLVHIVDNVLSSIDPRTLHASDVSINATEIRIATKVIDADIFNADQLQEMANGVRTINIPGFQANRDLVAYPDGGMENPVPLLFDPGFNKIEFTKPDGSFTYPTLDNVQRPKSDEDLAFMSVLQLGSLIRSKQVTSVELVNLYTARLKK